MQDDNDFSQRVVDLIHQDLDVMHRADCAPSSPVKPGLSVKNRRQIRRDAKRLRCGQAEPRYKNLYTAETLADSYERAAERDEIRERAAAESRQIRRKLRRLHEENPDQFEKTVAELLRETHRAACEQGPASEAARRLRQMEAIVRRSHQERLQNRRRKDAPVSPLPVAPDTTLEIARETAGETLDAPPPGVAVVSVPPEGESSGRERILFRIGVREHSWVGNFERGDKRTHAACLLPGDQHMLVVASGAGYVIERRSHALVERLGTDIVGFWESRPLGVVILNHDDMRLEVFGPAGRILKTGPISVGGFHHIGVDEGTLFGDVRFIGSDNWVEFEVSLETGEVEYGFNCDHEVISG